MLVAQAMGEYAGATVVAELVAQGKVMLANLRQLEPTTWAVIGLGAFGIWFLISRFR